MNSDVTDRDRFMILMGYNKALHMEMKKKYPNSSEAFAIIMTEISKKLLPTFSKAEKCELIKNLMGFQPMAYLIDNASQMTEFQGVPQKK